MEAAFSWVQRIFNFLFDLIPKYIIVIATHEAVLWRRGFKVIHKKRNFWYWPLVSDYRIYPVARQTVDIPAIRLTLGDKTIHTAGVAIVSISDIVKAIGQRNWNIDDTIIDLIQASAVYMLAENNDHDMKELQSRIKEKAQTELLSYGVDVEDFYFVKFVETTNDHYIEGVNL